MNKMTLIGVCAAAALMLAGCVSGPSPAKLKSFEKAMQKNDFAAMEKILQKNAKNINLVECMGDAIMPGWVPGFREENTIPVLKLLIRYGGNVNGSLFLSTKFKTPLLYIARDRMDVMRFLLE